MDILVHTHYVSVTDGEGTDYFYILVVKFGVTEDSLLYMETQLTYFWTTIRKSTCKNRIYHRTSYGVTILHEDP